MDKQMDYTNEKTNKKINTVLKEQTQTGEKGDFLKTKKVRKKAPAAVGEVLNVKDRKKN